MTKWPKGIRAAARALREDLWTAAPDPLSHPRRPGWLEWRPALAVPLVLAAGMLMILNTNDYAFDYQLGTDFGLLLAGVQSVALVVAMYRPIPAWWATTLVTFVAARSLTDSRFPTPFPWTAGGLGVQAGVLFLVALRVRLRASVTVLVISSLSGLVCLMHAPQTSYYQNADVAIPVFVAATAIGAALRGRAVARTRLVEQEELTAEERARRTLLEERNRIARELHDVVAHHMSVISIQAQVAPHLVENPSEELKENLAGIRENAVEALTELRQVLGVLRSEDPLSGTVRHAPQPTLDRLDDLFGNVRGAGLTVTRRTSGEPLPLSPGVELSAFRIVQEALSNAIRHAPGAEVRVEIGYRPAGVTVRITNTAPDRPAPASPGAGHGLLGMRERTAMLGGELATGPTPDGGWEVTALLPAQPPAAPTDPAEDTP
ncbi:sensor histidine kinase [Streptomyces netropsis]|uniref:histidine kinase n=1 Tax=Streptomyces netropsis TaxID=55404 RepID=A0A7W7LDG8_STRNE|nr:sensor histidine kinase [Streptomyces netropsis]MBB4888205.1 signal transduction histidine kinase [Streptomyces netropsis]